MPDPDRHRIRALAALAGLLTLEAVMLAALFSGTEPHPPGFLAPLIGAGAALGVVAAVMVAGRARGLLWPVAGAVAVALIAFGPHKLLPLGHPLMTAGTPAVSPAILLGSALVAVLVPAALRLERALAAG